MGLLQELQGRVRKEDRKICPARLSESGLHAIWSEEGKGVLHDMLAFLQEHPLVLSCPEQWAHCPLLSQPATLVKLRCLCLLLIMSLA